MALITHLLAEAAARLLKARAVDCRQMAGGDLSAVVRVTLDDGRTCIAKSSPGGVEAGMLRAMAAAGVRVPDVLAADADVLVIGVADDSGSLSRQWDDLGEQLKILHAVTGDTYGWPVDYAFGTVTIRNTPSGDWIDFWKTRRLLCFAPHLPVDFARRIETVEGVLPDLIPARPRGCLLHGDLWGGNVLAGKSGITMIDPACYHGDAAVDVAMLSLFDRPENAFYRHYGYRPDGETLAVYGLWPALVHVRLFGPGYLGLADRLLKRLGC